MRQEPAEEGQGLPPTLSDLRRMSTTAVRKCSQHDFFTICFVDFINWYWVNHILVCLVCGNGFVSEKCVGFKKK